MKIALASPSQRSVEEATTTTVSYEGRKVYNFEPDSSHKRSIYRNFDSPFAETKRDVCRLRGRAEGWDGYDTLRPKPASVTHAYSWVSDLYRDVRAELWCQPHVSTDEEGDVSFEWWNGRRKITVYVSPESIEYIKVEKGNGSLEMEDGYIATATERRKLWNWLIS